MTADAAVLTACLVAGIFVLGIEIGKQHQPMLCPVAENQHVVSTYDTKTEQICIYANAYGSALRKAKATKRRST